MKYLDEYRRSDEAREYSRGLHRLVTRPWTLMEICGGQTHNIMKFGIDKLLPGEINLVHGPGCPVCVTPLEILDGALEIASREGVIFCSFGDMVRVPASRGDLRSVKAAGGDVRMVYSPMDALSIARENPGREVVFFAVGFETTAPANGMAVYQAHKEGLKNFSVLVSHVLVPPAMEALLSSAENRIQGFLAAGHVCTVMGCEEYIPLSEKYSIPIVITGFEPLDLLQGIYMCAKQLEEGRFEVENQYSRSVKEKGNRPAQQIIQEVFEVIPRKWRGMGEIDRSGLALRKKYRDFDAAKRFEIQNLQVEEPSECISGLILQGIKKPPQCPAFGKKCTPDHPLGATMVSSEGTCAAYYQYREMEKEEL